MHQPNRRIIKARGFGHCRNSRIIDCRSPVLSHSSTDFVWLPVRCHCITLGTHPPAYLVHLVCRELNAGREGAAETGTLQLELDGGKHAAPRAKRVRPDTVITQVVEVQQCSGRVFASTAVVATLTGTAYAPAVRGSCVSASMQHARSHAHSGQPMAMSGSCGRWDVNAYCMCSEAGWPARGQWWTVRYSSTVWC